MQSASQSCLSSHSLQTSCPFTTQHTRSNTCSLLLLLPPHLHHPAAPPQLRCCQVAGQVHGADPGPAAGGRSSRHRQLVEPATINAAAAHTHRRPVSGAPPSSPAGGCLCHLLRHEGDPLLREAVWVELQDGGLVVCLTLQLGVGACRQSMPKHNPSLSVPGSWGQRQCHIAAGDSAGPLATPAHSHNDCVHSPPPTIQLLTHTMCLHRQCTQCACAPHPHAGTSCPPSPAGSTA